MNNTTKEWIKAGCLDIKTVNHLINEEDLTPVIAFHCEQAIEKFFKALLVELNIYFPKTHDLRRLHKLIETQVKLNDEEIDILLIMNDIYIESRYPGDMGLLPNGIPTPDDAKMFFDFAVMIYQKIGNLLAINKDEFPASQNE